VKTNSYIYAKKIMTFNPDPKRISKRCKIKSCKIKIKDDSDYCNLHSYSKKKNKYKAVRQTYKGKSYDSKLEAKYAFQLDCMVSAGEVKEWTPQNTLLCEVNGKLICRYTLDFYVVYTNGKVEYWEVKSNATKTYAWTIKWKLVKALFPNYNFVIKY